MEKPADHLQEAAASEASAAREERVELMMALGAGLQPPSEPGQTFQRKCLSLCCSVHWNVQNMLLC